MVISSAILLYTVNLQWILHLFVDFAHSALLFFFFFFWCEKTPFLLILQVLLFAVHFVQLLPALFTYIAVQGFCSLVSSPATRTYTPSSHHQKILNLPLPPIVIYSKLYSFRSSGRKKANREGKKKIKNNPSSSLPLSSSL